MYLYAFGQYLNTKGTKFIILCLIYLCVFNSLHVRTKIIKIEARVAKLWSFERNWCDISLWYSDNRARKCWDTFCTSRIPAPRTQCWEVNGVGDDCAICLPQHCFGRKGGGGGSTKYPQLTHSMFVPHCPQFTCMGA
jgi:hypothetical protein